MVGKFTSANGCDIYTICFRKFYAAAIFCVCPAIVINFLSGFISVDGINYFYSFAFTLNSKCLYDS